MAKASLPCTDSSLYSAGDTVLVTPPPRTVEGVALALSEQTARGANTVQKFIDMYGEAPADCMEVRRRVRGAKEVLFVALPVGSVPGAARYFAATKLPKAIDKGQLIFIKGSTLTFLDTHSMAVVKVGVRRLRNAKQWIGELIGA